LLALLTEAEAMIEGDMKMTTLSATLNRALLLTMLCEADHVAILCCQSFLLEYFPNASHLIDCVDSITASQTMKLSYGS